MIRKIALVLAVMAASALVLPLQGAAGAGASGSRATWQIVPIPAPGTCPTPVATESTGLADVLSGVAAVSATDVWAVGNHFDAAIGGDDGLIEHWDGSRWSIVPSPASALNLTSVAAISASDVWAAGAAPTGGQPVFEHWDGKAWTAFSGPLVSAGYGAAIGITTVSSSSGVAVGTTRADVRAAHHR